MRDGPRDWQNIYDSVVKTKLKEHFGYTNNHAIPRLDKIVLNMGLGEAAQDSKKVDTAVNEMARIAGQAPQITLAKTSVANFKLREGMAHWLQGDAAPRAHVRIP